MTAPDLGPPTIELNEGDEYDRIVIDRGRSRKDRFYIGALIVFWLVWTLAMCILTWFAVHYFNCFFVVWLGFGYIGVIAIPLALLQNFGREEIRVYDEFVAIRARPGIRTWRWARDELTHLSLVIFGGGDCEEAVHTLNLVNEDRIFPKRRMLAAMLHPDGKLEVFELLRSMLEKRGYECEAVCTYDRDE